MSNQQEKKAEISKKIQEHRHQIAMLEEELRTCDDLFAWCVVVVGGENDVPDFESGGSVVDFYYEEGQKLIYSSCYEYLEEMEIGKWKRLSVMDLREVLEEIWYEDEYCLPCASKEEAKKLLQNPEKLKEIWDSQLKE